MGEQFLSPVEQSCSTSTQESVKRESPYLCRKAADRSPCIYKKQMPCLLGSVKRLNGTLRYRPRNFTESVPSMSKNKTDFFIIFSISLSDFYADIFRFFFISMSVRLKFPHPFYSSPIEKSIKKKKPYSGKSFPDFLPIIQLHFDFLLLLSSCFKHFHDIHHLL